MSPTSLPKPTLFAFGLIALIPMSACLGSSNTPGSFPLQVGDLLFQDLDCGPLCEAIEAVTEGVAGAALSHVAMVSRVEGGEVWVIEAYADGVVEIPAGPLLARSRDADGKPKVLVGRLRPDLRGLVPEALRAARSRLGSPYDEAFLMGNGAYYCSELLYDAFREANGGRPVFELRPMTFREPGAERTLPVWQEYFAKRGEPVPEGEPGLNPGGMSTSTAITIVHAFGSPSGWRP